MKDSIKKDVETQLEVYNKFRVFITNNSAKYKRYIEQKYKGERGYSWNTIKNLRGLLKEYTTGTKDIDPDHLDRIFSKIRVFEKACRQLRKDGEITKDLPDQSVLTPAELQIFNKEEESEIRYPLTFYAYYHYVAKEEGEPELARAVLRIKDAKNVTFDNVGKKSINFKCGSFEHRKASGIGIIRLEHHDPKLSKISVYIKFYCRDIHRSEGIFLGSYTGFTFGNIVRGNIVFEPIQDGEHTKALLLSYKQNRTEFSENVDGAIRNYLSFRAYNHYRVPKRQETTEALQDYLDGQNDRRKRQSDPEMRFIDPPTPIVFIAFPNSSTADETDFNRRADIANYIDQGLKEKYGDKISVKFKGTPDPITKEGHPPESIVKLRQARIFILIYEQTPIVTFGFVQLGIAIERCNRVILFYKDKEISKNIERIDSLGPHVEIEEIGSVDEQRKGIHILRKITRTINKDLADYL